MKQLSDMPILRFEHGGKPRISIIHNYKITTTIIIRSLTAVKLQNVA